MIHDQQYVTCLTSYIRQPQCEHGRSRRRLHHRGASPLTSRHLFEALNATLTAQYKVNALGVIHGISAFLPLLRAAPTKKIVVIGSSAGHPKFVQTSGFGGMPAYSMTKAAALIATTKWAIKLKDEGFIVVTINPGLVDTSGTREEKGESLTPPGISSRRAGMDSN